MTIAELSNLKQRIDVACEKVAEKVADKFKDSKESDNILIVYHGHYSKIKFSLFYRDDAPGETYTISFPEADFKVSTNMGKDKAGVVVPAILSILQTTEIETL